MIKNIVPDIDIDAPKKPCAECPWRKDVPTDVWPVERFIDLAETTYDLAHKIFACHKSSEENPTACAGFLARGADNNLTVRMALMSGKLDKLDRQGDKPLYDNFQEMAIANGVEADHPALKNCRSNRP